MLKTIRNFLRERSNARRIGVIRAAFNEGRTLRRFVAKDVRREIQIVSIDKIEAGFIVVKTRTNNILYLKNKLVQEESFGEPQRMAIDKLWAWTGEGWGGLPDGTSIGDRA